jgi:hypothetical protein
MDSDKAAWVAGLLEGEAAFTKYVDRLGRARIGIAVSSVDEDVLRQLERFVPKGAVHGPYAHAAGSVGKQPFWTYHLHARAAVVDVLRQIRPRMSERRTGQIDALLELHAAHPPMPLGPKRVLKAHGTRPRYQQGCRCGSCRAADSAYVREWRAAKRKPA